MQLVADRFLLTGAAPRGARPRDERARPDLRRRRPVARPRSPRARRCAIAWPDYGIRSSCRSWTTGRTAATGSKPTRAPARDRHDAGAAAPGGAPRRAIPACRRRRTHRRGRRRGTSARAVDGHRRLARRSASSCATARRSKRCARCSKAPARPGTTAIELVAPQGGGLRTARLQVARAGAPRGLRRRRRAVGCRGPRGARRPSCLRPRLAARRAHAAAGARRGGDRGRTPARVDSVLPRAASGVDGRTGGVTTGADDER